MAKDKVVIANASGFWGDEAAAVRRQVRGGPIDYLTMDYLAEITMIVLARQKAQNESQGYARDFVRHVAGVLEDIVDRDIRVISNAGGVNPVACARALEGMLEQAGISLPVAVVDGADLMPSMSRLRAAGAEFSHIETGEPLGERLAKVNSANAYLGARPIVAALERGARIVVTGRSYDAASVVAPMVYEFGWRWDDWDRLACALLAGHLIECGSQVTGGNHTLWRRVPSYDEMGYPLVEAAADGSFVLTKHPGTGGLVDRYTLTEQTLYEIGDPAAYASPDVIADFRSFEAVEQGPDRVLVSGVKGSPPNDSLKVSITYEAGWKVVCNLVVSAPEAVAKARKYAEIFWGRIGGGVIERRTDLVGHSACWGSSLPSSAEPNEVVLRMAARTDDRRQAERIARELPGLALAGPAGVCGAGTPPQVSPAFGYWPALIPRSAVAARLLFEGESVDLPCDEGVCVAATPTGAGDWRKHAGSEQAPAPARERADEPSSGRVRVALGRIALARSGDKGDTCNVGVAALRPEYYGEILREVTEERVADYYRLLVDGPVTRYRLDNLSAVNFVLERALGGGGTVSLQFDNQGKTLAQGLLAMEIEVEETLLEEGS